MEEMLTAHDIKKLWPDNPDIVSKIKALAD
jgi:hypothetical protein